MVAERSALQLDAVFLLLFVLGVLVFLALPVVVSCNFTLKRLLLLFLVFSRPYPFT